MKIHHISDTHGYHSLLNNLIFDEIDILIHSGDASNTLNPVINSNEMLDFIEWYKRIPVQHKIYVAGNHDSSLYHKTVLRKEFENAGIIYLELDEITIDGVKFFGSPYTPTFGNWCFMKSRGKLEPIYNTIPDDTNVLISHGPPFGILDLSYNQKKELEFCGCKELRNRIWKLKQLQLVTFGHIHSNADIINTGVRILEGVTYSNGSVVTDNKFGKLTSYGNIIEI